MGLPQDLIDGKIDAVEIFIETVLVKLDPELARQIRTHADWPGTLELIQDKRAIALVSSYLHLFTSAVPPTFYAHQFGQASFHISLEIVLIIIGALLGGVGAVARVGTLIARLAKWAKNLNTASARRAYGAFEAMLRQLQRVLEAFEDLKQKLKLSRRGIKAAVTDKGQHKRHGIDRDLDESGSGRKRDGKGKESTKEENTTGVSEPVNVATGEMYNRWEDFRLGESFPMVWERGYTTTKADSDGPLWPGFTHSHDLWLRVRSGEIKVRYTDGRDIVFSGVLEKLGMLQHPKEKMRLWSPDHDRYVLEAEDGTRITFKASRNERAVYLAEESATPEGRKTQYRYDRRDRLRHIDVSNRSFDCHWHKDRLTGVSLTYQEDGEATVLWLVRYRYDEWNRLKEVLDAADQSMGYRYFGKSGLIDEFRTPGGTRYYWIYDGATARAKCLHTWGDEGLVECRLDYRDSYTVVTDSRGHQTTYHHEQGMVTQEVDAEGRATVTVRDKLDRVVEERNADGKGTRYVYDDAGHLTAVIRPDGSRFEAECDERGLVTMVKAPSGRTTRLAYNEGRQLILREDPDGLVTEYVYEGPHLMQIKAPGGRVTRLAYDAQGELACLTSPNGGETQLKRDGLGRVTSIVDAEGKEETRRYDRLGRLSQLNRPNGEVITLEYDAEGNLIRQTRVLADGEKEVTELEYTPLGRVSARTVQGKRRTWIYDTEGDVVRSVDEWAQATDFVLDCRGQVIRQKDPFGVVTEFERDGAGQVTSVRHPGGKITQIERSPLGAVRRVRHRVQPRTGQTDLQEIYSYDEDGLLILAERLSPKDRHQVTIVRDEAGRAVGEQSAVVDEGGQILREHSVALTLDEHGDLAGLSSSLGVQLQHKVGPLGQLVSIRGGSKADFEAMPEELPFQLQLEHNGVGDIVERITPKLHVLSYLSGVGELLGLEVTKKEGSGGRSQLLLEREVAPSSYLEESQSRAMQEGLARMAGATFSYLGTALLSGEPEMCLEGELTNLYRNSRSKEDWRLGPAGKQVRRKDAQGRNTVYHYDREGRIAKREAPTGLWRYRYDRSGRLRKIYRGDGRVVSLRYDALGRCIERKDASHRIDFVWNGDVPLHEVQSALPAPPGEVTAPWPTPMELARLSGGPVRTWLFSPEDKSLLGRIEQDQNGVMQAEQTLYALHGEAGLPCGMVTGEGAVKWKDDGWKERGGCFAAATLVHTEAGPLVPIEHLRLGTEVKTARSVRTSKPGGRLQALVRAGLTMAASLAAALLPGGASAGLGVLPGGASAGLGGGHSTEPASVAEDNQVAHLSFRSDTDSEHRYDVELLRPRAWFESQGVTKAGDRLRLQLDELKAEGWATVHSLHDAALPTGERRTVMRLSHHVGAPSELLGSGSGARLRGDIYEVGVRRAGDRLGLGLDDEGPGALAERVEQPIEAEVSVQRVLHEAVHGLSNDVYEVFFVEGGEALRGTGAHPLYSLDRDDWVRVRDLQVGERLQTADGAVTVEALEKVRGLHRVYNLEVEGDHEYLVGEEGIRAHNSSALNCSGSLPRSKRLLPGLNISGKQFGKKFGQHAEDFGLNPRNASSREWVRKRIMDIARNYQEVRQGPWRGGVKDAIFYREGVDVVVSKSNGDFITILSGGINNKWFKAASGL